MLIVIAVLIGLTDAIACQELSRAIQEAEEALCLGEDRFTLSVARLGQAISCSRRALTLDEVKAIHRAHMLSAVKDELPLVASQSATVLRRLGANMKYISSICDGDEPSNSALNVLEQAKLPFAKSKRRPWSEKPIARPRSGALSVDGVLIDHSDLRVPDGFPYILAHSKGQKTRWVEYVPWNREVPFYPRRHHGALATGIALVAVGTASGIAAGRFHSAARRALDAGESGRAERLEGAFEFARTTAIITGAGGGVVVTAWFAVPAYRMRQSRKRTGR